MKIRSIRFYFFTTIATVLIVSVLVMGMIQTVMAINYFREDKKQVLVQVAGALEEEAHLGALEAPGGSARSVGYMSRITGAIVFITDTSGQVHFSAGDDAPPVGARLPDAVVQTLDETGQYDDMTHMEGLYASNHYTCGVRLEDASGEHVGYAFASFDAQNVTLYLMDTISTYVMSAALVLFVASVLALVLFNRTVLPLRRVAAAAHRFAEGDYSARVPVEGDDELAQLAITFNEMANSFEATDTSRRSFMGNIAHELRTPMTTIKGFIDGMLDGTIPPEQRDKYLMVVSDEVGRLARLTKNMLDISRLEAGEYSINIVEFDIWGPLTSVILAAEQRLEDKNLSVRGLEHDEEMCVLADEDFVHQVLFNLVDNAIKFASEDGYIGVRVEQVKNSVVIAVRNSGDGIPADALPYVFDRFYKADKSRGGGVRGAGLGLHISKVLVGLMSGRIWVESEEGQYTEFLFTLPAPLGKKPPRGRKPPAAGLPEKPAEGAAER